MTNPALLVGLGGLLGAVARYGLGERIDERTVDTFVVNVAGSFLLGVLVSVPVAESLLLFVGTGFCGAFTTFSTFAFETVRLAETGRPRHAVMNAAGTLLASLAAVALGGVVGPLIGS